MENNLKKFIAFKLEQKLNLMKNSINFTKEEIAGVMKKNIVAWCSEAVAAGV